MFRLKNLKKSATSTVALRKKTLSLKSARRSKKRKKSDVKDNRTITGCVGLRISLGERWGNVNPMKPNRLGCSSRCRHAAPLKDNLVCSGKSKTDDWISEDMYKHFTETDSRPLSPENYSRRSGIIPRSSSVALEKVRKCVTPEPDTKQCQFHHRRVLILDLRRVKSVDAITRQNSLTTGESADSTYGDCDNDNRSSSVNRDSASIFHHSPRNFSVSRSSSPKVGNGESKSKLKRQSDRPGTPVAYERSSSPKILEGLTLPPLHQSVLTLLGQKSGSKSSPRNIKADHNVLLESTTGGGKAKKLRRHGRKKKAKDEGKESEEKELDKGETTTVEARNENIEDMQETQLNIHKRDNAADQTKAEGVVIQSPPYIKNIVSLRDVLDEHLRKDHWSQKEMESLNREIEKLSVGLKRYETDFKSKSISMNEETWLAFPRTCTNTSATFGVPLSSKLLRELNPATYLRDYVLVSEPRRHIYNLIYQRYRILENPTGKSITVKSLQPAVTEVLGRQFSDEETNELRKKYLDVNEHFELDKKTFAGICAFCERIYGKYELEKCKECILCSMSRVTDKERCHVKRKSELEQMDLSYLSRKIKFGEAQDNLRHMIEALSNAK